MFQILVVEDDKDLNRTVCAFLNHSGYRASGCLSAGEAYDAMYETVFDLIVSDIMMPGIDGFTVCKKLREMSSAIGIIMLSAKTQEMDKVSGLMLGADDYMVKPFEVKELIARIKAILRRCSAEAEPEKEETDV